MSPGFGEEVIDFSCLILTKVYLSAVTLIVFMTMHLYSNLFVNTSESSVHSCFTNEQGMFPPWNIIFCYVILLPLERIE